MLQTDDLDTRREACRLLLQALYANGRVNSKRYCYLDFRPGEGFSVMAYDTLYKVCSGGAVIVRYLANDDSEDEGVAGGERDTIERICEVAKHHRNQVLTIICLPRECKKAKALFYENLGSMAFVEIREDFANGEQAQAYLKMLCKDHRIRTDKALFAALDAEKGYLATDLRKIFEEWYNKKLQTAIYPQYKELKVAKKEVVKQAPKGSAYDDLQEMVGLTEAKSVIQKALNYYKMQKLYEEKGVKQDNPAMHMVFTGNPGTAKTTVARLFARIMRDNGLLSKGQLVEVGRGDLVGKYVGWTAQIVQAKFREAKGGVLFIDEAYSLVEHHNGSYGDEAINTIVQEMENHREDVAVIFAGYPEEMEHFLQRNPGLRSRIAFHVPFADYNAEELCQIAELMGKHKGIRFEADAKEKLHTVFEDARKKSDFGNGRFVRNILEQAKMNQASRLLELEFEDITTEDVQTIRAEDIVAPEFKKEVKRAIGFAR
jgi:SpoVK/Ycf46/Vps4 family AAA+-type ATPase